MKDWSYLYASVKGKGHVEENIECQDYSDVFINQDYTICVVSDGAGSCANSSIGAENVVKLVNIHFSKLIEENDWHTTQNDITLEKWQQASYEALRKVRDDLERKSIEFDSFKSLSCTLIVVIHLHNKLLVTHIGDGRAGYCNLNNEWYPMMTPYKGNYNNETVFITSDIWKDEVGLCKYIESKIFDDVIKAFCLLSDGCENASFECYKFNKKSKAMEDINKPYKKFFQENVDVHIPYLVKAQKDQKELNEIWGNFLNSGNEKLKNESDDKTMILAVKVPE